MQGRTKQYMKGCFDVNDYINNLINILGYDSKNISKSCNDLYDYVYCVYYTDNESNLEIPYNLIGIKYFDIIDEKEIQSYHRIYWNSNDMPISILVFKNEIRIYNNFTYDSEKALLYSSNTNSKSKFKLKDFSIEAIATNTFWGNLNSVIKESERVDKSLLNNLEATIDKIHKNTNCNKIDTFNFITQCILIKYLEDRKILVNSTFSKFNSTDLTDMLSKKNTNLIIQLFDYFKDKFNSDFFDITDNDILSHDDALEIIFDFFSATDIESGQLALFPYDFSIIPIELISSIYENFFDIAVSKKEHEKERKLTGSFYTPYFLANFIVEREIDLTNQNYRNIKILDPACGSGVFLVSAFKKIVKFYKDNNFELNATVLNKIIKNQIFGVDKNLQALKITEFSLYIALLDCLDPKDIEVNQFRLPNLITKTLCHSSYFEDNCLKNMLFDIVIGNPPWYSIDGDHVTYCQNNDYYISDKQLAQAFVYRAKDFIRKNGTICFILPNSIFCNTNSCGFRNQILKKTTIEEVLNLSSIRKELFANASFPCSIVKFKENTPKFEIHFVNFMPNVFSDMLNKIVFDFNNGATISSEIIQSYDYVWNIILSGDFYDFLLVKKLKKIDYNIETFIKDLGLIASQGYSKGNGSKKYDKYNNYNYLNSEMEHYHIIKNKLIKHHGDLSAERIHNVEQYEKHNKVIFRRTIKSGSKTNYASSYNDKLLYNNKYYCIFDKKDVVSEDALFYLEAILNSKLYIYYQFNVSTAFKINPPEIRLDRVMDFPIIKYDDNNKIIKRIVRCVKKIKCLYSTYEQNSNKLFCYNITETKRQIDATSSNIEILISELYGLENSEIDTINYTIDCRIPMIRKKGLDVVSENDLSNYCCTIKKYFDDLLSQMGMKIKCNVIQSPYAVAVEFNLISEGSDETDFSNTNAHPKFLYENANKLLVIKRIKIYSNNGFAIIKTVDRHNWHAHNAYIDFQEFIKDSFETKGDII